MTQAILILMTYSHLLTISLKSWRISLFGKITDWNNTLLLQNDSTSIQLHNSADKKKRITRVTKSKLRR